MIINTGMRTDIQAFYSEWFLNRLREGFVLVRNPYHPNQVTRYTLSPHVVDLIGFCTKNPAPMLPHLDVLEDYGQYWFVTITPYGRDIEPNVPDKDIVIQDFRKLSKAVGKDCMGWRYDPIILNDTYTIDRHLKDFEYIASQLEGYTTTCVISFIEIYAKVLRNFPQARNVPKEERLALGKELIRIGRRYGMTIKPCACGNELAPFGADCSGCMTFETYERAYESRFHCKLEIPRAEVSRGARKECACYLSRDIGAYNTCGHLCRYCYANYSEDIVRQNMAAHNPESPLLIGEVRPEDTIHQAAQQSWRKAQMSIFDYIGADTSGELNSSRENLAG